MEFLLQRLLEFFQGYGYAAVFLVLIACGFGLPIPEDITLVSGGIISSLGRTNVHVMFAVGMAGVLIGDGTVYTIGRVLGKDLLKHPLVSRLLPPHRYRKVQDLYEKYGRLLVFLARFMPGLRTPIFLVAGISRVVPLPVFFLVDGLAAMISVPFWVYLGFFMAHNFGELWEYVHRSQLGILSAVAIAAAYIAFKFLKKKKAPDSEPLP